MAVGTSSPFREKRMNNRKRCSRTTELLVDNRPYRGSMKNISIEGVFIEIDRRFRIGQKVTVRFNSSRDNRPIIMRGEVVRNNHIGVGVRFKH